MHAYSAREGSSRPLPTFTGGKFTVEKREESSAVVSGQAIVLAFLTMQCLGAVIKVSRQIARGPEFLILADAETFWIGLSGVVILGCSWTTLLRNERWISRELGRRQQGSTTDDSKQTRTILTNFFTLITYCTLFSIPQFYERDVNNPLWDVGFFHFL
jgi:hypothetical protein